MVDDVPSLLCNRHYRSARNRKTENSRQAVSIFSFRQHWHVWSMSFFHFLIWWPTRPWPFMAWKMTPKFFLDILFIFYFIRIDPLNKILCSSHVALPSYLPIFGCLTLTIVFDIFKFHVSDPYLLVFPGSFLSKAIWQFLSFIDSVTFHPSNIKWTDLFDFYNQVHHQ